VKAGSRAWSVGPTFPNAKYLFSRTENEIGDPDRNPAAEADPQHAALASEASGQRGNSMVRAHSASEDARKRADDTRPEPGSSARDRAYRDSVLPVIEAGQAVLLDGAHAIDDALMIEPAPGHTTGHIVLKVTDRDKHGVVCGDVIHHPLQVYAPHWNSGFCELPEQARITRRRVLGYCAEHKALLFPVHFGAPHVAAIEQAGEAFSLRFVAGGERAG
jgi:glyoxylase-like metal-dependent hydrolase (beta-lactamase superfamily II)